jgi:hypothetical protein
VHMREQLSGRVVGKSLAVWRNTQNLCRECQYYDKQHEKFTYIVTLRPWRMIIRRRERSPLSIPPVQLLEKSLSGDGVNEEFPGSFTGSHCTSKGMNELRIVVKGVEGVAFISKCGIWLS